MQGSSWMALLARIPADQSENLLFMTNNGTSIAVKGVVRAENEYVVVRGRLMGTTDEGGGFFFVPYDQINYVGFQKQIKEAVILSMYDGTAAAKPSSPDQAGAETASSPADAPTPPPVTAPTPGSAHPPGAAPGKAALLERLRARRSDVSKIG